MSRFGGKIGKKSIRITEESIGIPGWISDDGLQRMVTGMEIDDVYDI